MLSVRPVWSSVGAVVFSLVTCLFAGLMSASEIDGSREEASANFLGPQEIFSDDFETGGLFQWTDWTAGPASPYRFADLDLRDPHVFVDVPVFGCFDFTDTPFPANSGPSFNQILGDAITTDGDMDGFLDLSLLLLFRPLSADASRERVDSTRGRCSAPLASTSCGLDPMSPRGITPYSGQVSGVCLEPISGTTGGYSPAITSPGAPCFVTEAEDLTIDFNGLSFPLRAGRIAGTLSGSPTDSLTPGLLMGFLREADADTLLLPADLPIVGGEPLSILLRGGTNNCSSGNDLDSFEGEPGWWFYFNYIANTIPYTGP